MTDKVNDLRRKTVISAAGAAVLAAGPALSMTHGHRVLGLVIIGIQVVLLVVAVRFFAEMKKASGD